MTAALAGAIIILWGAACVRHNLTWKDNLAVYRNCVEKDPQSATAHVTLSRAYYDAGKPVEAEEAARAGLALDPGCAYGYINLSYFSYKAGKKDKAIELLEQGAAAVPESPLTRHNLATIHLNLGLIYAEVRDYQKAEKNLLRSNEILPRPVGWYHTGNFYLERGRYEEARQMFEQTLRKTPRWFAPIHMKLGQTHDFLGQTEKAREEYRKYLELAPPDAEDRNNVMRRLAQL